MIGYIKKGFLALFIPYFFWIYLNVLLNNQGNNSINIYLMILFIIGFCFIIVLFWKNLVDYAEKLSRRRILFIICAILGLYLVAQLFLGYQLAVTPSWDFGQIYRIAQERITTGQLTQSVNYLTLYPNNKGAAFLLFAFYRFLTLFGVPMTGNIPLYSGIVFNCILVNLSIFLACLFFLRIGKKAHTLACLLLLVLSISLLLYSPIFYSDTLSILFPMILLHLFINLEKYESRLAKSVNWLLVVLVTVIGMSIKLTVLFTFIAYAIYRFAIAEKGRKKLASVAKLAAIGVLIFVVNLGATSVYNHFIVSKHATEEPISYQHWIHMGMMGNGGYNEEALQIEEQIGVSEALKRQFSQYSSNTYFHFLTDKGVFTWGDGLYFANVKLVRQPMHPDSFAHLLFLNKDDQMRPGWVFYANVFHGILLFFILSSLLKMFISKKWQLLDVLKITFCGLFLFLMIWETRSRYLVNYIPFFVIMAIDGIDYLGMHKNKLKKFFQTGSC